MRPRYLIALLLLIPLADALFLVVVADFLGWQLTVALVVLTAILGMLIVRAEGRHTLRAIQRKAARGDPPTDELLDGAFLIAAGAFLLTPGLVTDTIGFLFALPITRAPIRIVLKRYVVVPYLDKQTEGFVTGNVWVGGFPAGDEFDGFGPAAGDDTGGPGPGPAGGSGPAGGPRTDTDREGDPNDVVDVDFTVADDRDDAGDEDADDEDGSDAGESPGTPRN